MGKPEEPPRGAMADGSEIPREFLCPLSGELMRDPVVVASGETYDRLYIQVWLNAGNRTCPRTKQVLSHSIVTPNHLVRRLISAWCMNNAVCLPPVEINEMHFGATPAERQQLENLLQKISLASSIVEKKKATKELRSLTRRFPSFRALLGENPDGISWLLSLLSLPGLDNYPELQEDAVTTILNVSILDENKKRIGDNPRAIPLLIDVLKSGTMEARSNAAAALFTLSALDENKLKIGRLGAMGHLLQLLEQGNATARKDAASAIFNLCLVGENKCRAILEGVVAVLLNCLREGVLIDECLAILAMLGGHREAVEELCRADGLQMMLTIIRGDDNNRNRENAMVVLHSMCSVDRSMLRVVREEEECSACISWLADNGTSRARRKASSVLDRLNRSRSSSLSSETP